MLGYLKERLFPLLIAFSALSVSVSAAFYSVSGLSKLFAGAAFAVIVMAASLEIAKLVIASLLYQYRKNLPKLLKWYLSMACVVLILITSMGIYGFLSAAYQETAAKAGSIDSQITLIEVKRDNIKEQLAVYNEEKSSINSAVADLRTGLSNNKIQYTDTLGNVITTTSRATRNALTKQLDQAIDRQTIINGKVDDLNQKLFDYETEIVEVKLSDAVSSELGPLKYLSGLTGLPMDQIINYLLLTIIFVFDPLAIALVVAANFAFEQLKKPSFISKPIKIRQSKKVKMSVPEGMEFDKSYPLPKMYEPSEIKVEVINQKPKSKKQSPDFELATSESQNRLIDKDEERINIIGQNGNDGLHYDKLDLNKDGVVDDNERLLVMQKLKSLAHEAKMSGNTALYEVYKSQINDIKS